MSDKLYSYQHIGKFPAKQAINYRAEKGTRYATATGLGFAALLRPHLTPSVWPSISNPLAHAAAASSADGRSVKFTNAHLQAMMS